MPSHGDGTMVGKGNPLEILETFFKKKWIRGKKLASQILNPKHATLRPFETRGVIQKQTTPFSIFKEQ